VNDRPTVCTVVRHNGDLHGIYASFVSRENVPDIRQNQFYVLESIHYDTPQGLLRVMAQALQKSFCFMIYRGRNCQPDISNLQRSPRYMTGPWPLILST
jgi:hypothetical protein